MTTSETSEEVWLDFLEEVAPWEPPNAPLIVLVPHPDDETLGCGGLICEMRSRGVEVTIIAVTDGENAYPDDDCAAMLGPTRAQEHTSALARLGVSADRIIRLRLPDSGVTQCESRMTQRVLPVVSRRNHILAPWIGDFHPDHEACGRVGAELARQTGAALSFYFFWTWHRRQPASLKGLNLGRFEMTPDLQRAKAEALAEHKSQLVHPSGGTVLPDELLAPARRTFEIFGRP